MPDGSTFAPACYRVTDLARRWACSASTVRNRIATGNLQCLRFGTMLRIPVAVVAAYEAACLTAPPQTSPDSAASPAATPGISVAAGVASLRDARIERALLRH
jgi:hypothetical protein